MSSSIVTYGTLKTITLRLLDYCRTSNWAGWDPYDALNSPIFKYVSFVDFRWTYIAITQLMKRSPVNLRPLLFVPKTENPKAIALFLMSFLKLKRLGLLNDESLIQLMIQKLIKLRSSAYSLTRSHESAIYNLQPNNPNNPINPTNPSNSINQTNSDNSYWCWGYSFPWQTRTILVPRGYPNLVCTTFVANALLDLYENHNDSSYLEMAKSSAEYIVNELYWEDGNGLASLSYPIPSLKTQVHNANLLGAALMTRVHKFSGEKKFLTIALKVARYSASRQHADGSWSYGEHSTQRWIDNFHTGYNLCALRSISEYAETSEFDEVIYRGFKFYQNNFFTQEGIPKYFHDRLYPVDIHNVAQSIITLLTFKDLDKNNINLAQKIIYWAFSNMWDEKGYFHYQINRYYRIKIPYIRWSQAWMLLALTNLLDYPWPLYERI